MSVILYTKPQCVQCTATKRLLDREGIAFHPVNLPDEPEALEYIKELGYQQAPVVVLTNGDVVSDRNGQVIVHWSGFRPDLLNQLADLPADPVSGLDK